MAAIGVDTHKFSLAACAVDERGTVVGEASFANDPAGHKAFARWAAAAVPGAVVGIEGSATYGAALVRSLGPAWSVCEVPPHLTRRERIRTRRPGKSDPGDALAIARVTLREHELPPPRRADASRDLQLLVEARDDLVGEATRMRNRLHADLLVLLPGDRTVAGRLVGPRRRALVASRLRRRSELQAELARSRLAALRRLDVEIAGLETRIAARVAGHPLLAIPGVGPLVAAAPEPYRMAARELGVPMGELCLVAAHTWDVVGALSCGCRAAFVARPGMVLDPEAPRPDTVGPNLSTIATSLIARHGVPTVEDPP